MAENFYVLPVEPVYHEQIRRLARQDPADAESVFNPLIQKLVENTHFVRLLAEAIVEQNEADHAAIRRETIAEIAGAVEAIPTPDVAKQIGEHDVSSGAHAAKFEALMKLIAAAQAAAVPADRKINGKPLSADINLTADNVGAVPKDRTINGKPLTLNITLVAADVGAVPTTRTINGKPLSGDINLSWFAVQASAPSDTKLLWIDTNASTGGLKYHNGSAWVHVPVGYT